MCEEVSFFNGTSLSNKWVTTSSSGFRKDEVSRSHVSDSSSSSHFRNAKIVVQSERERFPSGCWGRLG